jgi:hypothetical protein
MQGPVVSMIPIKGLKSTVVTPSALLMLNALTNVCVIARRKRGVHYFFIV